MTFEQLKHEAAKLPASDRIALVEWISQGEDVREFQHQELVRELKLGLEEADRGELIDADEVFADLRAGLRSKI